MVAKLAVLIGRFPLKEHGMSCRASGGLKIHVGRATIRGSEVSLQSPENV